MVEQTWQRGRVSVCARYMQLRDTCSYATVRAILWARRRCSVDHRGVATAPSAALSSLSLSLSSASAEGSVCGASTTARASANSLCGQQQQQQEE